MAAAERRLLDHRCRPSLPLPPPLRRGRDVACQRIGSGKPDVASAERKRRAGLRDPPLCSCLCARALHASSAPPTPVCVTRSHLMATCRCARARTPAEHLLHGRLQKRLLLITTNALQASMHAHTAQDTARPLPLPLAPCVSPALFQSCFWNSGGAALFVRGHVFRRNIHCHREPDPSDHELLPSRVFLSFKEPPSKRNSELRSAGCEPYGQQLDCRSGAGGQGITTDCSGLAEAAHPTPDRCGPGGMQTMARAALACTLTRQYSRTSSSCRPKSRNLTCLLSSSSKSRAAVRIRFSSQRRGDCSRAGLATRASSGKSTILTLQGCLLFSQHQTALFCPSFQPYISLA